MTTWELATDAQRREVRQLIDRCEHAGIAVMPMPSSAREPELVGLTKRDAGVLITWLREALGESR